MLNTEKYQKYSATKTSYPAMQQYLQKFLATTNLAAAQKLKIELGFEEAVVNVITYSGSSEIYLALIRKADSLSIDIIDFGSPFDPLKPVNLAIADTVLKQKEGGLGIFFLQKIFKLTYTYEKLGTEMANHLTMTYNINKK